MNDYIYFMVLLYPTTKSHFCYIHLKKMTGYMESSLTTTKIDIKTHPMVWEIRKG